MLQLDHQLQNKRPIDINILGLQLIIILVIDYSVHYSDYLLCKVCSFHLTLAHLVTVKGQAQTC